MAAMRLALPVSCGSGHRYYRESGTTTQCPYCLQRELILLRDDVQRTVATTVGLLGSVRSAHDSLTREGADDPQGS